MYVGVDIGGSKTLVGVLNDDGVIRQRTKFATPPDYSNFLLELRHALAQFEIKHFKAGGIGVPGTLDRERGLALYLGNLPWTNVPIKSDIEHICHCPIFIENDAKLAGLSESMLLKDKYTKVLYVTVSTGIGYGLIINGVIDSSIGDGGGRAMVIEHQGKMMPWEDFAGGRAIVERYGKMAKDIHDQDTWKNIGRDLAKGLVELIAIMQPEVIVIGGSVGEYFERYSESLNAELKSFNLAKVSLPDVRQAQRPTEAVLFGCYDYAKASFKHG